MNSLLSSLNSLNTNRPIDAELVGIVEAAIGQLQEGRAVDVQRLVDEHPKYAEQLRELLPMVTSLVQLGGDAAAPVAALAENGKLAALPYKQLGDFLLIRELGRGGMGMVYEAEQLSMGRRVALKVLPFAALAQDKSLQRFRNEVRAAAALDHPHIVSIYSVGEDRGVHYYAMQLIRGQSLAELIHELREQNSSLKSSPRGRGQDESFSDDAPTTALDAPEPAVTTRIEVGRMSTVVDSRQAAERYRTAALLGIQAAEALQHAHDQGVLHRDVKPSNFMLDAEQKIYVTDFGLARNDADTGLTTTGDLVGTLRYMSPEQVLAQGVLDCRSDVYSLGVTLYELATLEPAFQHASRGRLIHDIVFERFRRPRSVNPQVPAALDAIICKATERDPAQRYPSALDMADDLRKFLDDKPVRARRRRQWAIIVALLVAGLAAAFAGVLILVRDRQGNEKARLRVENGDAIEIVQTQAALDRAERPPVEHALAPAARPLPVPALGDDVVRKVRPARPASPRVGDPSLAIYFAYGPVGGGSTLVQVNWDGTVRGYSELPYSISGLAADRGRLLATIGSSRVGQGRVISINERGLAQTVFRDKKLLPDTTEIWSSIDSDNFLVADNGADLVAAILKGDTVPPEVKVKLPRTANYQSMSVAMSDDGSVLFSDSDQNGVFRLAPGSGPTLGKPLLNESGAVSARPGTTIWAAALEDNLHIFDGDQHLAEMAYPVGMTLLRPIIDFTKGGTLVLGFYPANRQYIYAVDIDAKQFHLLFTVDVSRMTALVIAPKMDWTEGDAVQLQWQGGDQPLDATGASSSNHRELSEHAIVVANANGRFSLSFDGQDDFVKIPSLTYDGGHPITIELRATPASQASYRQLVLVSNFAIANNQDLGISLFQRGDRYPQPNYVSWAMAYAAENRRSHSLIAAPDAWQVGRTTQIAFVADGRRYRFYLDGKLWKHGELDEQPAPSDQPFMIGGHDALNGFYQGAIDEVRISNAARYSMDYTPVQRFEPDANTMALYHCEEGRGNKLIDSSGNGHHGEVKGASWLVTE